jgi:hypothetical protein
MFDGFQRGSKFILNAIHSKIFIEFNIIHQITLCCWSQLMNLPSFILVNTNKLNLINTQNTQYHKQFYTTNIDHLHCSYPFFYIDYIFTCLINVIMS